MFKPFKPPSFVRKSTEDTDADSILPLPKRQKVSLENRDEQIFAKTIITSAATGNVNHLHASKGFKRPLQANRDATNISVAVVRDSGNARCYNVLWRKPTAKKNKTWDSDGIMRVSNGVAYLHDISGKTIGKGAWTGPLLPGSQLRIGGKEVEVDSLMSVDDAASFKNLCTSETETASQEPGVWEDAVQPQETFIAPARLNGISGVKASQTPNLPPAERRKPRVHLVESEGPSQRKDMNARSVAESYRNQAAFQKWKNPIKEDNVLPRLSEDEPTPRHDPKAPNALVMRRPTATSIPKGKRIVDVVVDPILSSKLREHQRGGVKFLYECVMGMKSDAGQGAILADDMGLGKTLQTIALIWTMLKQNPIYQEEPVIRKALIVCPVTLIKNWRKEFRKWLGSDRIGVFVADDKKTRITDFTRGRSYSVMVIGYDRLRSVYEELQKGQVIDLVVADEGHRLKTAQSKSSQAIQSLSIPRRIILSGTPIQNNLGEFFSMVDFVNPGVLGTLKAFNRNFETPIERSRQPGALASDIEKGESRSEELADITNNFILRRTTDVLAKYLPPKTESILLCRPTSTQAAVYKHVLASPIFQSALGSAENALQLITILKKVCNSPQLLAADPKVDPEKATLAPAVAAAIPPHLLRNASASSKLQVLDQLLYTIREFSDEKVVIVSNFTSTLDVLENLLNSLSMPFLRLDGATASSKRQDLVDTFNRTDSSSCFAFLLSAKAGGMGINLIGASRLVLFDVDWNPAIDLQAMARIHRDGQKRPCYIYRLLVAGALDEKIWQRQVTKLGLANNVLESKSGQSSFTREELKDLFRLDEGMRCQTHELIGCCCNGKGSPVENEASPADEEPKSASSINLDVNPATNPSTAFAVDDTDSDLDLPLPSRRRDAKKKASTMEASRKSSSLTERPQVIKASEVDMISQEKSLKKRSTSGQGGDAGAETKLDILLSYRHLDTRDFANNEDKQSLVEDSVLRKVLSDEDSLVNFVFSKRMS